MKKTILAIICVLMCLRVVAQKFEVIWEHPFDDFLQYYEEWPDDIGYNSPGLSSMLKFKDTIVVKNNSKDEWFYAEDTYKKISKKIVNLL